MKVLNILMMKQKYKLLKRRMGCSTKRRKLQAPQVAFYRSYFVEGKPWYHILFRLVEVVLFAYMGDIFMQHT